ncbi:MAG TPA: hypothetical protein VMF13_11490 [Luteitalea sp.]|nr:hypothetical protein [Luteitalea sp.]
MPRHITPTTSLDALRREAKRWLSALREGDAEARSRYLRAMASAPSDAPSLRDVQLALAREFGVAGWTELRARLDEPPALRRCRQAAAALCEAYATGDEQALQIVWEFFGHRRTLDATRRYVHLDLGRPETAQPGDTVTLDDAQQLVARVQRMESWDALMASLTTPAVAPLAVAPIVVHTARGGRNDETSSRDWDEILDWLDDDHAVGLDARSQMTDAWLARVAQYPQLTSLGLEGCAALSDEGLRALSGLPQLRELDLSGCRRLTDRGLAVLRELPALESIRIAWTSVSDEGLAHLAACPQLRQVDVMGTPSGDGVIRALAGHAHLHDFRSGNGVTGDGIAALRDLPMFRTWHGGTPRMSLTGFDADPTYLLLRGPFGDQGLARLAGLDGLFALNVDATALGLTGAAIPALGVLPHLEWLAFDAHDDAMPHIAALPGLRFLMCQDTPASDDGFEALSGSRTLEYLWGRRCHNLRGRGFAALSRMPALKALSVSCLNVDDEALATLPAFPSLVELMPMDVPDAGYRHIGRCRSLESLVLMYCRDTGDEATSHLTALPRLRSYFASYTRITDRTPQLLSTIDTLESVVFDTCAGVSSTGIAALSRLPALREVSVSGMPLVTREVTAAFGGGVRVRYAP